MKICQEDPFDIVTNDTNKTLGLCCVEIPELMAQKAIKKTPPTSQLCYKPLVRPQRRTESQKVHISSHDGFSNFITSTMLNIGPRIPQSGDRVAEIRLSLTKY